MNHKKDVKLTARVPTMLKRLIDIYLKKDAHINQSDLIRDALREKIQRDAPHLYREIFLEEKI